MTTIDEPAYPGTEAAIAQDVRRLLNLDESYQPQAEAHVRVVATFVHGYVRGRGFNSEGLPTQDLAVVIASAACRYLTNPTQAQREQVGSQSITHASLEGFTLAEQSVLHRYRRRTA